MIKENPYRWWIVLEDHFVTLRTIQWGKKGQDEEQRPLCNQNAGTVEYYGTDFFSVLKTNKRRCHKGKALL